MVHTFRNVLLMAALFVPLSLAFNNCQGPSHLSSSSELTSTHLMIEANDCSNDLLKAYSESYFPFVTKQCKYCHISGPGLGTFASPDLQTSYQAFSELGAVRIKHNATNPDHHPPYTGPENETEVEQADSIWSKANETYLSCLETAQRQNPSQESLLTKNILLQASTTAKTLTFDLSTDVASGQRSLPIQFSLDAKIKSFTSNGVTYTGYEFSNPQLLVDGGDKKYYVSGFMVRINDMIQDEVTTFKNLQRVASPDQKLVLLSATTTSFLLRVPQPEDQMAIEFMTLTETEKEDQPPYTGANPTPTPTPTPVPLQTFTQLAASSGVFGKNCLSCHNSSSKAGGLDLSNYSSTMSVVKAGDSAASTLYKRMTNSSNPMPPSGVLASSQTALVKRWIDEGAKQ